MEEKLEVVFGQDETGLKCITIRGDGTSIELWANEIEFIDEVTKEVDI